MGTSPSPQSNPPRSEATAWAQPTTIETDYVKVPREIMLGVKAIVAKKTHDIEFYRSQRCSIEANVKAETGLEGVVVALLKAGFQCSFEQPVSYLRNFAKYISLNDSSRFMNSVATQTLEELAAEELRKESVREAVRPRPALFEWIEEQSDRLAKIVNEQLELKNCIGSGETVLAVCTALTRISFTIAHIAKLTDPVQKDTYGTSCAINEIPPITQSLMLLTLMKSDLLPELRVCTDELRPMLDLIRMYKIRDTRTREYQNAVAVLAGMKDPFEQFPVQEKTGKDLPEMAAALGALPELYDVHGKFRRHVPILPDRAVILAVPPSSQKGGLIYLYDPSAKDSTLLEHRHGKFRPAEIVERSLDLSREKRRSIFFDPDGVPFLHARAPYIRIQGDTANIAADHLRQVELQCRTAIEMLWARNTEVFARIANPIPLVVMLQGERAVILTAPSDARRINSGRTLQDSEVARCFEEIGIVRPRNWVGTEVVSPLYRPEPQASTDSTDHDDELDPRFRGRFKVDVCPERDGGALSSWLRKIDPGVRSRIEAHLTYMIRSGAVGDSHIIKGAKALFEARIHFGPGYRIYFRLKENSVLLLHGGTKASQAQDIAKARAISDGLKS